MIPSYRNQSFDLLYNFTILILFYHKKPRQQENEAGTNFDWVIYENLFA